MSLSHQRQYEISRLEKRTTDRGFNLNELPPESSPSHSPSTQHPSPVKRIKERESKRKYLVKYTFQWLESVKDTMGDKEYQRVFEKIKQRRESSNLHKRKRRQERNQRKSNGTLTEKDNNDIQKRRERFKKRYYKLKAERESNEEQNKLKNANSAALAQIDNVFKPHQTTKGYKKMKSSSSD